jgi:hypothetical protein
MRSLRMLIISLAIICVMSLGAIAFVSISAAPGAGGDDIIIKGGSLEIQCGANHNPDCLGTNDSMGKYKHKQSGKHITKVVIKRSDGTEVFNSDLTPVGSKPEIDITYK